MPNFQVPQTFQPGVLDRHIPFGKVQGVPALSDVMKVVPESDWLDIIRSPNKPTSRELVWRVLSQGSVGSCASEAKDGSIMLSRAGSGRKQVLFNPYGTYGRVNGGSDRGSSLTANMAFAKRHGCFPEDAWPRSNGWRATPNAAAYEAASHYKLDESYDINNTSSSRFYQEFFSALLLHDKPIVYFGYPGHAITAIEVTETASATPDMISCADAVDGYIRCNQPRLCKCTLATELPPGSLINTLLIGYLNSWGSNWGSNGIGWLRASNITRSYGAFAIRTAVEDTRTA